MPRFSTRQLPTGYNITEYSPKTADDVPHYQAYLEADPEHASPLYTRRRKAIDWCLLDIAERVLQQQQQQQTTPTG